MKYAKAIKKAKDMGRLNFWGLYSIGFNLHTYKHSTRRIKKMLDVHFDSKNDKKTKGDAKDWYI